MIIKICPKCGQPKTMTEEVRTDRPGNKIRRRWRCNPCYLKQQRELMAKKRKQAWGPNEENRPVASVVQEQQKGMTPKERKLANHRRGQANLQARRAADQGWSRILLNKYGITRDQYLGLLQQQDYTCAIEGCDFEHRPDDYYALPAEERNLKTGKHSAHPKHYLLNVDHCHETGAVRGLICTECNLAVGHMEQIMKKTSVSSLTDYIVSHRAKSLETQLTLTSV